MSRVQGLVCLARERTGQATSVKGSGLFLDRTKHTSTASRSDRHGPWDSAIALLEVLGGQER